MPSARLSGNWKVKAPSGCEVTGEPMTPPGVPVTRPSRSIRRTVSPGPVVPKSRGRRTLVMLSPWTPVSSGGERASDTGGGATVVIVSVIGAPTGPMLPARSTARACTVKTPSGRAWASWIVNDPLAAARAWPSTTPLLSTSWTSGRLAGWTSLGASPRVPLSRGRLTLVMPSPTVPESSAGSRLRAPGAAGGVASMTTVSDALTGLTLPAGSSCCTV